MDRTAKKMDNLTMRGIAFRNYGSGGLSLKRNITLKLHVPNAS